MSQEVQVKPNGTQQQRVQVPLTEAARKRVEANWLMVEEVYHERDQLLKEVQEKELHIHKLILENENLTQHVADWRERAEGCLSARDRAVEKRKQLETILLTIRNVMVQAGVPNLAPSMPEIEVQDDDQQ